MSTDRDREPPGGEPDDPPAKDAGPSRVVHTWVLEPSDVASGGRPSSGGTWGGPDSGGRAEPPPVPLSGRTMGPYELVRELARGGMGVVYVAWDPRLQRRVALKVLPGGTLHAEAEGVARFMREARAVASLDHPGVVRVYDIGEQDDSVFFAMDLVEGGTLADRIATEGALDPHEAATLLAAISRSLAAAHARGIVHRDMKPGNVLLERDGTPKLTDFGLATRLDDLDSRLTNAGQVLGTPSYMAPEQAMGRGEQLSAATDVYAVGVIAFELLTGDLPWKERGMALVLKKPELDAVPPRSVDPEIPVDLDVIVTKAMAREPADRYPSATALADDLERFLRGEPIQARPPTVATRLRWMVRRNRRVLPIYLGGALALLAVGALAWASGADERREQTRQAKASRHLERVEARMAELQAAGREREAERAFHAFVLGPEVQRTEALARAFQGAAARAEDHASRIAALARAFQESRDPDHQREILVALGQAFRQANMPFQVSSVVALVDRRGLDPAGSPAVAPLRAWVAASELRLAEASAWWMELEGPSSPRARASRALASATSLGSQIPPHGSLLWDADDDGQAELAWWAGGQVHLRDLRRPAEPVRSLETRGAPAWDGRRQPVHLDDQVFVQGADGFAMVELDAEGRPVLHPIQGLQDRNWFPRALLRADLDHDGRDERYLGIERTLVRLDRSPTGWQASEPLPALGLANSDVMAALHVDLDGDGVEELALGTAEWGAYDVRVYGTGDGLQLRGRQRLGEIYGLAYLPGERPLLAAMVRRVYTARIPLLPEDPVFEGVVLLALGPKGLEEVGRVPYDTDWFERMVGADVDGDGQRDLVLAGEGGLAVLVADGQGGFEPMVLDGQLLLGVANLDQDPADELVLRDSRTGESWIAGAGSEAPPVYERTHGQPQPVPETGDPWLESGWSLAEDLVALGLREAAAEQLYRQARLVPDSPGGALALVRAVELMADTAAWDQVGEAAATLASWSAASEAQQLRVRELLAAGVFLDEERALLAALPRDAELEARLQVLDAALAEPARELRLDQPLDPAWRVLAPELVQHELRAGRLAVGSAAGQAVLELPVELGEGPLVLDLDLHMAQVEWGGRLELLLRPLDAGAEPDLRYGLLWLQVQGGQGRNHLAGGANRAELLWGSFATTGPMDWDGRVSVAMDPARRAARLRLVREDGEVVHQVVGGSTQPFPPPGRYALQVVTDSQGCLGGSFGLSRLALRGAGARLGDGGEQAPTALDEAARLAVGGWPERALALLEGRRDLEAARVRLAALDALGEAAAAAEVYEALVEGEGWPRALPLALLRHAPAANAGRAADALGPDWPEAAWTAWQCSAEQVLPDPAVLEAWTEDLPQLASLEPATLAEDRQRLVLARALLSQGQAWQHRGSTARARRALDRAERALDAMAPTAAQDLDAREQVLARRLRADLLLERAAVLTTGGGAEPGAAEQALALLEQALAAGRLPELVLDRVRLDPRFAPLHDHPGWVALVRQDPGVAVSP